MTGTPCRELCVLDPITGWCIGCGRTAAEIAAWTRYSPDERRVVTAQLPDRLARMTSRAVRGKARPRRRRRP